jgi:hypothetical protein
MAYYLVTEGMTPEQRQEIDDILEGPTVTSRKKTAEDMAAIGGHVVPAKRKVTA